MRSPKLPKVCMACRAVLSIDTRFCGECGAYQNPSQDRKKAQHAAEKRWITIKNCIVFYVIYLCTIIPIYWIPEEFTATASLVVAGVDALLILIYWRLSKVKLLPKLKPTIEALRWTLWGIVALAFLLVINFTYHGWLAEWLGTQEQFLTETFKDAGYGFAVVIFDICVMPAIWEEIAFRGLLQSELASAIGRREAIFTSAILFAVIHVSVLSGPYLFLLGVVLAMLRYHSASILPGIVVHFLHNLVVIMDEYQKLWVAHA